MLGKTSKHNQRHTITPSKTYRVSVVGSGGVGKSALTLRFIQGVFVRNYDPTLEDTYCKMVRVEKKYYTLEIIDTAWQEEYQTLTREQYITPIDGFILVYSITSSYSFDEVAKLRYSILRTKAAGDIPIMLVGNKLDLHEERSVDTETGRKEAEKWGAAFMETSAKTDTNVESVFTELIKSIEAYHKKHTAATKKRVDVRSMLKKSSRSNSCVLM